MQEHDYRLNTVERLLDLGFYIFGEVVRNIIRYAVKKPLSIPELRELYLNDEYFDMDVDISTAYFRTKNFEYIDACVEYGIFQSLDMTLYSNRRNDNQNILHDLEFIIMDPNYDLYLTDNITFQEGNLDLYHIMIKNKYERLYDPIYVNLFVYKDTNALKYLFSCLIQNIDFNCNKVYMYKNIDISYAVMGGNFDTLEKIRENIEQDNANTYGSNIITERLFNNYTSMIISGWNTQVGSLFNSNLQTFINIYILARKEYIECHCCNRDIKLSNAYIYIKVGDRIYHLQCYINLSVKCWSNIRGNGSRTEGELVYYLDSHPIIQQEVVILTTLDEENLKNPDLDVDEDTSLDENSLDESSNGGEIDYPGTPVVELVRIEDNRDEQYYINALAEYNLWSSDIGLLNLSKFVDFISTKYMIPLR